MVDAPFDAYLDTPNKSIRQNVPRAGVCLHGAAMTSLSGLEYLTMGGKEVSATAIAKDSVSKQLMTDAYRAWSLSSAWGDSAFRSCECANESTEGWTFSDASHWELARMVAYWAQRDGFWPHRDGDPTTWTVVGHREMYTIHGVSYATSCPGGMGLDLVTARAQQLLRGALTPQENDMATGAFFRNPGGGIAYQREPNTPLISIDLPTWQTYAANGNKYADVSQASWDALVKKCGTALKPEPTGGSTTVGDVSVAIDYIALAKAIWDEQSRRIAS